MAEPTFEAIRAMFDALRANAALKALVKNQIFDRVPQSPPPTSPYVSLGPFYMQRDDATCISGLELFVQLDVWTWGADAANGDSINARLVSDMIAETLHNAVLPLPTNRLVNIEHRSTEVFLDVDKATQHGVVRFWISIER